MKVDIGTLASLVTYTQAHIRLCICITSESKVPPKIEEVMSYNYICEEVLHGCVLICNNSLQNKSPCVVIQVSLSSLYK